MAAEMVGVLAAWKVALLDSISAAEKGFQGVGEMADWSVA